MQFKVDIFWISVNFPNISGRVVLHFGWDLHIDYLCLWFYFMAGRISSICNYTLNGYNRDSSSEKRTLERNKSTWIWEKKIITPFWGLTLYSFSIIDPQNFSNDVFCIPLPIHSLPHWPAVGTILTHPFQCRCSMASDRVTSW